jgi:hypothetical protein
LTQVIPNAEGLRFCVAFIVHVLNKGKQ